MKPLTLIFMGTPEFALPALERLYASVHKIAAIYTQPPRPAGRGQKERLSPVHAFALEKGIPVYTPASLKDETVQTEFSSLRADAAVVVAYGLLLPKAILEGTRYGCINIHPSLLPRWRGAAPIQRTVMAGDRETGVVIMQMNAGLDTGDMLKVRRFAIPPDMTSGILQDRLAVLSAELLTEVLAGIDTIVPVRQPEEGATYAAKITREECRIEWNDPAEIICNQIRGLAPAPGASFLYKKEVIKLFGAEIVTDIPHALPAPGTVMDNALMVACGQGALRLHWLQRPGKKMIPVGEMLKGYSIPAGERLA